MPDKRTKVGDRPAGTKTATGSSGCCPACADLVHLNALVMPLEVKQFDPFPRDFCLTDVVAGLYSFPEGLASKASVTIWLVTLAAGTSEPLFTCFVDKHGHQIHLTSGIFCPKGSYLTANGSLFVEGATGNLRVLLTGHYCEA